MRCPLPPTFAFAGLLGVAALLSATAARADGAFPDARQILLPPHRPEQLILATNFGLIFSEDSGSSWLFSCEQSLSAFAGPYLLGAAPSYRLFALTSGAGLIHSDDESCSWAPAGGALSDVMPYAFAVDPTSEQRVYAIGVPRENFDAGESLYVSTDGGITFGAPAFTAPARTALMTVMVAPSRPSTLLASVFSGPENHPSLLRSLDAGQHWEVVADLVDSLGGNPFELLAIDPADENVVYVRILGAADETLAISRDGGLTFARLVSIPGKLNAFLKLASGTVLVGGSAGNDGVAYRSSDAAQTFQRWSDAPNIHALAERGNKLYIAANNFADGYAIGESEDEGLHIHPLAGFKDVRGLKSCVADACASSCAYQAGINLWPNAVCGAEPGPGVSSGAAGLPSGAEDASPNPTRGGAAASSELERRPSDGCACSLAQPQSRYAWACLAALLPLLRRRAILRRQLNQGVASSSSAAAARELGWQAWLTGERGSR